MSNWKAGDKALCVDDLEAPELKAGRTYLALAVSYWGGLVVDSNEDGYASCRFELEAAK